MKIKFSAEFSIAFMIVLLLGVALAFIYVHTVMYTGQGLIADDFGSYDLVTEICGIVNGANIDGPYLLLVLTAQGAKNAYITGRWGVVQMAKTGNGTFNYVTAWYDLGTLPENVYATYDGKVKNAQLTIRQGCRPSNTSVRHSPSFGADVQNNTSVLIGVDKNSIMFNSSRYALLTTSKNSHKDPAENTLSWVQTTQTALTAVSAVCPALGAVSKTF